MRELRDARDEMGEGRVAGGRETGRERRTTNQPARAAEVSATVMPGIHIRKAEEGQAIIQSIMCTGSLPGNATYHQTCPRESPTRHALGDW